MYDMKLCSDLLDLEAPWCVESCEVDVPSQRVDVTIGFGGGRRRLLGASTVSCPQCGNKLPAIDKLETNTLRHLPLAGFRTFLRVPAAGQLSCGNDCAATRPWSAEHSGFTTAMEAQIVAVLETANSSQAAAQLLAITAAEARAVAERHGVAGDDAPMVPAAAEQASFELVDDGGVPGPEHPAWPRLLDGEITLRTEAIGLQMLLHRARQAVLRQPGAASRRAAIQSLRDYFVRNPVQHAAELDQLLGRAVEMGLAPASTTAATSGTAAVPAPQDPCWQRLINGEVTIETRAVALNMMLERVRVALVKKPSDANRAAASKIIRQFFVKHQRSLASELAQLRGTTPATTPQPAPARRRVLPGERDPVWQALINGRVVLDTDAVSLKLMLEKIRRGILKNPSDANRIVGAKILRQYFAKHHRLHPQAIRQLIAHVDANGPAAAPATAADRSDDAIPPERSAVWQRLINGELALATDAVSLQLMLERVRLSILNNPSEANRIAGAKILRQYFSKHRARHRAEIQQLLAA